MGIPLSAIIPLRVDALSASDGLPILPAFQKQAITAPRSPQEVARTAPLAETSGFFRPGMHLHWAMPERLSRGQTDRPKKLSAFVQANGLYFPCLPNRWWIGRKLKDPYQKGKNALPRGAYDAMWIVESDVIAEISSERREVSTSAGLRLPIGRVVDPLSSPFRRDKKSKYKLSAVGISGIGTHDQVAFPDPHFAAFYPSCHAMFGYFDESYDDKKRSPAEYTVIGWYSHPAQDPLSEWASAAFSDPAIARAYLERHNVPFDAKDDPLQMANALRFGQVTGWDVPKGGRILPTNLVCYGKVTVKGGITAVPRRATDMQMTMGSTPAEAAASLLANGERAIENDLFGIISHREMAPHKLDPLSKLRDLRHTSSFTAQDTHDIWSLAAADEAASPAEHQAASDTFLPPPDLPAHLADCLDALNRAEQNRAALVDKKQSLQQQLFDCWLRYRDATDGKAVDLLPGLNDLMQSIQKCDVQIGDAEEEHAAAHTLAQNCLDTCNAGGHVKNSLKLVRSQGPRYWRPADPVLALTETTQTGTLLPAARHVGPATQDQPPPCLFRNFDPYWWYHSGQVWADQSGNTGNQVYQLLKELEHSSQQVQQFRRAAKSTDSGAPWNPVAFEWDVTFQSPKSLREQDAASPARYLSDAVTGHFHVAAGFAEFANSDETLFADTNLESPALSLRGRAFMHHSGEEDLAEALRGYLSRIDALREARGGEDAPTVKDSLLSTLSTQRKTYSDILAALTEQDNPGSRRRITTVPLGGLIDQMLGRQALPQAFVSREGDFALTDAVIRHLADAPTLLTARPGMQAHPLATGTLTVAQGRIVDSFGQSLAWDAQHVTVKPAETLGATAGEKIILPPRLTQAARLDFRWLSGTDDNVESNAHPLTSPLCGWLIPSHQDCWVLVYDAAGVLLGYVDDDRKWQPAPGDPTAPSGPASIPNRHLGDVVGWMTSRRDDVMAPEGTDKLIAQLEAVTGTIEPEYAHGDSAHALFLGRPLAVARAFVGVSGKQSAILNDAFDTVKGLDDIALPVRLGDKSRSNDGLVGYFTPLTEEARGMSPAGNVGTRPPAQFSEITEDAPCLHLHLSGQAQRLTLLLDPRCPVHARCGLLPTKSIHMPVSHYAKSLSAIEMLLSVSPVLMEPEGTAVPHPHEPGRSTTWITRRDGTWQLTGHQPTIEKSAFLRAFNGLPTDGEMLWLALQTKGWIATQPAGKARLLPAEQRQPLEGFASEEMALLLGRLSKVLRQPEHHATFGRRGVLQEGWLKLGLGKR